MKIVERDLFAEYDDEAEKRVSGEDTSPAEVIETAEKMAPSTTEPPVGEAVGTVTEEPEHEDATEPVVYEAVPVGEDPDTYQCEPDYEVYEAVPVEEYYEQEPDSGVDIAYDTDIENDPVPAEPELEMKGSIGALFRTFFKIGVVTFGGGYAMIPMIESEVVEKRQWIEKEQFLDLIAISQTCPGVFAINISTFIGYKLRRTPGAILAALGAALPSFLIILAIAMLFRQFQDVPWVAACFKGIRPAVVALIAVPTFNLAKSAKINLSNVWIPLVGAFLIYVFGVNPIFIILGAAFLGYLYGTFLNN